MSTLRACFAIDVIVAATINSSCSMITVELSIASSLDAKEFAMERILNKSG